MRLLEYEHGDAGWDQRKIYAVRTFGALENYSKQTFYHLITAANELHNYGPIRAQM